MIGYVYDDGGRLEAGFKGIAGDCVARALAVFTGESYEQVYRDLAAANKTAGKSRSARNGLRKDVYEPVYLKYGLVKVRLPKGPRPTYTEAYGQHGDCIVSTAKHIAAIVDGELRDTFDGRTYEWGDTVAYRNGVTTIEPGGTRERKAQGVWVLARSYGAGVFA